MFCVHCGTQIDEGANFCKKCGAKLTDAKEATPPNATAAPQPIPAAAPSATVQQIPPALEKRGASMATLIAAGIAVVLLGGAGIYFGSDMLRPTTKPEPPASQPPAAKPMEPGGAPSQDSKTGGETADINLTSATRSAPKELPPNVEVPKPPVEVLSKSSGQSDVSGASSGGATAGTYQTLRPTSVYEAPSPSAKIVANIDRGVPVNVVGSNGDFLEVRSKSGKPPGFIRRGDATLTEPAK
jgi:hypothetical protein